MMHPDEARWLYQHRASGWGQPMEVWAATFLYFFAFGPETWDILGWDCHHPKLSDLTSERLAVVNGS